MITSSPLLSFLNLILIVSSFRSSRPFELEEASGFVLPAVCCESSNWDYHVSFSSRSLLSLLSLD